VRVLRRRYGFAVANLAVLLAAGSPYTAGQGRQARLIAWAQYEMDNLEHEPVGPLLGLRVRHRSGSSRPGRADRAGRLRREKPCLGNTRDRAGLPGGQVIGSLVAKGIIRLRSRAGSVRRKTGHISDVDRPTWCCRQCDSAGLRRMAGAHAGRRGNSGYCVPRPGLRRSEQLGGAAVGNLTAASRAAAATPSYCPRRAGNQRQNQNQRQSPVPEQQRRGSCAYVPTPPDPVGDRGARRLGQLPDSPPERLMSRAGPPCTRRRSTGDGGQPRASESKYKAGPAYGMRGMTAPTVEGCQRGARRHSQARAVRLDQTRSSSACNGQRLSGYARSPRRTEESETAPEPRLKVF